MQYSVSGVFLYNSSVSPTKYKSGIIQGLVSGQTNKQKNLPQDISSFNLPMKINGNYNNI